MKTTVTPTTPADAGLSLSVVSGPTGQVLEDWPCIAYVVSLSLNGREIWRGDYRLGVGHVKPFPAYDRAADSWRCGFTENEENLCHHWGRKVSARFTDKQLWSATAAKLAKFQKVAPKLEDVAHSLLSEGSAYFDAQRFEDWAADLGYDPDSRKAEATFKACDEIGRALSRAFTPEQLEGLREWAGNY